MWHPSYAAVTGPLFAVWWAACLLADYAGDGGRGQLGPTLEASLGSYQWLDGDGTSWGPSEAYTFVHQAAMATVLAAGSLCVLVTASLMPWPTFMSSPGYWAQVVLAAAIAHLARGATELQVALRR